MKRRTLFSTLSLFIIASVVLTACASGGATDEPAAEPFVVGTTDSWSSFESAWVYSFHDWELFHQCADGLLNNVPGSAGEVEPALAESYTVSADGTEYTFNLREGVTFPNGDPFNADAVVFSLNRIAPVDNDENAGFLYTAYATGVEKIDDMTVKVTFAEAFSFAPQLVATNPWKILNPNQWTSDTQDTNNQACGIGPYTLTSFTEGEEAIFEANESYYDDAPKSEKLIVRYFADSPTMALALKNGEIDVAWKSIAPADQEALASASGIITETAGGTEIRYIVFNATTPPYDDPNVRLALAKLVDREQLADLGWGGIKVPLFSMVPPGFLGHKPTYAGTEDVEAGLALLAEAGFDADNPLVLDLWYSPTHYGDTEPDVAAVLKQQWEATGVLQVSLQTLEWAAYRDAGRGGELPVSLLGWYPDYLDPDNFTNVFAHSPAAWSGSYYNNPDMDALLDAQALEQDEATRIAVLEEIQDLWVIESPFVPLSQGKLFAAYREGVSGVVLDPLALFHYFLLEK
ncbi:MAG: hypothetical protein IIC78_10710 [Chloroflexi bacterium]|nr:hypothetical protein [Chloroflexota bacterium]